jgi:ketosteroid isomerase-like protein
MTTATAPPPSTTQSDVPLFSVAGAFLEGLAAQDFSRIAATLADDAHLTALVPSGFKQWHGTEQITAALRRWFGDVDDFELVDASVGEVGQRLHLRWRVRVQATRFGVGWFVVEQQVYADTGPDGRIAQLFLLCSGFCREVMA